MHTGAHFKVTNQIDAAHKMILTGHMAKQQQKIGF